MFPFTQITMQSTMAHAAGEYSRRVRGKRAGECLARARQLDAGRITTFVLLAVALALAVEPAFGQTLGGSAGAGGTGNITTFLQNLVNIVTGTAGKLLAVLAICFVGIGALMGALSLRAAGGVIMGVMLIFSAAWIVDQIVA